MSITTDHGADVNQRRRCRSARCITSRSTTQVPYWIYSNMQDDGTMRGPSNAPERSERAVVCAHQGVSSAGGRTRRARRRRFGGRGRGGGGIGAPWEHGLGGCESGFTLPDLTDTDIVWASLLRQRGDALRREDEAARARSARGCTRSTRRRTRLKYRCHWTPPLAIDPFDHNTVYYGCQVIFATTNGGQSWTVISPDLSTQDPSTHRVVRRHRRRQPRPVLRRGGVRDRAVGDAAKG